MASPKAPKNSLNAASIARSLDALIEAVGPFDFEIGDDDYFLYELNRLIDEDRASFEDEEFRILIDEGIRTHVEENLPIRCKLAFRLRSLELGVKQQKTDSPIRAVRDRVIRALENTEADLRNVAFVVLKFAEYLFERLQSIEDLSEGETKAREVIEAWIANSTSGEKLIADLQRIGRACLGPAADLLLNSTSDRNTSETALALLSGIHSPVSARVLAYVVSEPVLDEDLEARAYSALRNVWPLARPYVLHSLHLHAHEDLPFRWFQLLIETDEATASELIYEEMRAHGRQPDYLEDLWALASLMTYSRDPEIEDKVIGWINNPDTPSPVIPMLQEFLKEYRRPDAKPSAEDLWAGRVRLRVLNEEYIAASRLFDAGRLDEARPALKKILQQEPNYPFAVTLLSMI